MPFQSPNHTQVPNDFFDMIPNMSDAELRATLVLMRETFGYHRISRRMGLEELAKASGLSVNGVKEGTRKAESRGTFKRTNPSEKTKAEWSLVVEPSASDRQPVMVRPSASDGLDHQPVMDSHGTKESINKDINKVSSNSPVKKDYVDALIDNLNNPLAVKERAIAETYDKMDKLFNTSFARNKNTDIAAKFIMQQEKKGDSLERFIQWATRDEFNASRIWEYAENPSKIKTRWATAMLSTAPKQSKLKTMFD